MHRSVASARWLTILLTAQAIWLAASCGWAEVVTVDSEDQPEQHGFEFVLQSSEVLEVLDDFDRYCGRGDWDRAFKNLEKLQQADRAKMLRDKQGFVRPVGARLQLSLARLSPAGRAAFRLFYDAEAKQHLAAAKGEDELAKLTDVFNNYFASSVGDEAADQLGDLHFERGEMAQAAGCWQAVLQDHPDSALSRLRLLTKSALACARGGHRQRFDELRQLIAERYTGQTLVLGGRTVDAAEYLTTVSLASVASNLSPMTVAAAATMADFELPKSGEPLWKFNFYSSAERERLESSNNNWNARLPISSSIPPLALDASRCYVDVLGTQYALDMTTGKLLWRSGRPERAMKAMLGNPYGPFQPSFIAAADGRVWQVAVDPARLMQDTLTRLWCRDAAGGKFAREHNDKLLWDSHGKADLATWHPIGQPLPAGDRLFVCAYRESKPADMYVLGIAAATGKLNWSTLLGTRQVSGQGGLLQQRPEPCLVLNGDSLFVETHDGALARVNSQSGRIEWGFQYESRVPGPNEWWNYQMAARLVTSGPPLVVDGKLYFKGMRSSRLYAIDLAANALLWQRPVAESALLVSVDAKQILLSGEELISLDAKTQKLRWARRLPSSLNGSRPWVSEHYVYDFTSRGIFQFERASGDTVGVFRGADLDSLGGRVYATGPALVTVSNLAITAYPVKYQQPPAPAAAPASSQQP